MPFSKSFVSNSVSLVHGISKLTLTCEALVAEFETDCVIFLSQLDSQ